VRKIRANRMLNKEDLYEKYPPEVYDAFYNDENFDNNLYFKEEEIFVREHDEELRDIYFNSSVRYRNSLAASLWLRIRFFYYYFNCQCKDGQN
jgi:hypothetical protein